MGCILVVVATAAISYFYILFTKLIAETRRLTDLQILLKSLNTENNLVNKRGIVLISINKFVIMSSICCFLVGGHLYKYTSDTFQKN